MIVIETARLRLREHGPGDLMALHAMLSDPALTFYMPDMRRDDIDGTRAYLDRCIRDAQAAPRLRCNLAIEIGGTPAGSVGLHHIDGPVGRGHWGLGFFIRPDLWNRGYATESVNAALERLFADGAHRVSASALAENLGSRRVLEKCGFIQEGLLKHHTFHDGAWADCAVYRLLREEYHGG